MVQGGSRLHAVLLAGQDRAVRTDANEAALARARKARKDKTGVTNEKKPGSFLAVEGQVEKGIAVAPEGVVADKKTVDDLLNAYNKNSVQRAATLHAAQEAARACETERLQALTVYQEEQLKGTKNVIEQLVAASETQVRELRSEFDEVIAKACDILTASLDDGKTAGGGIKQIQSIEV